MKKKFLFLTLVFLFVFPVTLTVMQGDDPSPRLEITGVNATQLPTVTITVNVFDELGQPVSGLGLEDFALYGELVGQADLVKVENISDDNLSFATVLVIDVSSSMAEMPIDQAKEAAKTFISAIGPNDPVAIVTFGTSTNIVQDYTTDKTVLLNTIDAIGVGGKTALYDAGLEGVDKAAESPLPRRAVVLLSDGAEYGGVSTATRDAALNEAIIRGVPVYTIGLGYGVDRSYLRELSNGTNARNYESPTPDELIEIYRSLADLLRSQYVLSLNVNVPLDGTVYELGVQATTAAGDTNQAVAALRAPIPVPIVSFPQMPTEPISEVFEITADIAADDGVASVEFVLDGQVVEATENSVTVDPATLAPGAHELTLTVTDSQGDTNTATLNFEVAALPPQVDVFSNLSDSIEVSDPQTIVVNIGGQTAPVSATFSIDGTVAQVVEEAPFEFTFDPFELAPGEHTLSIDVLNEGGQTTTVTQPFVVAMISPVVSVQGLEEGQTIDSPIEISIDAVGQTPIAGISVVVNDESVQANLGGAAPTYTIDPMTLPPGPSTVTITVTSESGATTTQVVTVNVAALAPEVSVSGLEAGDMVDSNRMVEVNVTSQTAVSSVTYTIDGETVASPAEPPFSFDLDVLSLSPGDHTLSVDVTNAGGQTTTASVDFTIDAGPSMTATASSMPTSTPVPTDTSTSTPEPPSMTPVPPTVAPSDTSTSTPEPPSMTPVPPTVAPSDTSSPTDTVAPSDTSSPTDTQTSTSIPPSDTSEPTEAAQVATETDTESPTDTQVVEPSSTLTPTTEETMTATELGPTLTPVEMQEIEAPSEESNNNQTLLIVGIVIVAALVALFLFWRNRQK